MKITRYIPIRVCSPAKDPAVEFGYLYEIYTCKMLQAFFKAFKDIEYAVLSRKNGICLSSRKTENYGNREMINGDLLDLLKAQAPLYKDVIFLYWNHRPLTHNLYVKKMRNAGFNVIEFRKLAEIKDFLKTNRKYSVNFTKNGVPYFNSPCGFTTNLKGEAICYVCSKPGNEVKMISECGPIIVHKCPICGQIEQYDD